jgi:hypothetical protein
MTGPVTSAAMSADTPTPPRAEGDAERLMHLASIEDRFALFKRARERGFANAGPGPDKFGYDDVAVLREEIARLTRERDEAVARIDSAAESYILLEQSAESLWRQLHEAVAEHAQSSAEPPTKTELPIMQTPLTEREALFAVMQQAENDLQSAHAEICKLQNLDPAEHNWPDWTPQANSLRWFAAIRERFNLTEAATPEPPANPLNATPVKTAGVLDASAGVASDQESNVSGTRVAATAEHAEPTTGLAPKHVRERFTSEHAETAAQVVRGMAFVLSIDEVPAADTWRHEIATVLAFAARAERARAAKVVEAARKEGERDGLLKAAARHDAWAAKTAVRANDSAIRGNKLAQGFELTEVRVHEASAADLRAEASTYNSALTGNGP